MAQLRLIIILLFLPLLSWGQSKFNRGAIVGGGTPIDSITLTGGVIVHDGGTTTNKSRLRKGFILNNVYIDSISDSNGDWVWYRGLTSNKKFETDDGIIFGHGCTIDSVHITGADIDGLYVGGVEYTIDTYVPNTIVDFEASCTKKDTITITAIDFDDAADSVRVLAKTLSYPLNRTNGTLLIATGDTSNVSDDFYFYSTANVVIYVATWTGISGIWTPMPNIDTVYLEIIPDTATIFDASDTPAKYDKITIDVTGYDVYADSFRLLVKAGSYSANRTNGTLLIATGNGALLSNDYSLPIGSNTVYFASLWSGYNNKWTLVPNKDTAYVYANSPTPPALDSAEIGRISQDDIYLFFSKDLNEDSIPTTNSFSLSGINSNPTITNISIGGDTIILSLDDVIVYGDIPKIDYTIPVSGKLQDALGNITSSWINSNITNYVPAGYFFAFYGWEVGNNIWTVTDINRDLDTLLITINDTAYYRIIGDSSLVFNDLPIVYAPDTVLSAPQGIAVYTDTNKVQSIIEDTDTLNWNIDGWLFEIKPPPVAPDPLAVFTVSPHNRGDTAITNAIGFDATADSFRLNYVTGLTPPTTKTSGTLVLADDDSTLFKNRHVYIDVPDDNTNYAFALWSGRANLWTSNTDTVQLDSIAPPPVGASTLLNGLISYWNLDEASGDALDAADANDGTVDGGVLQNQTGKISKCYTFDGDGYEDIVVGDPANLQLTVFTISLWAKSSAGGVGGWWVNYTSATNAGIRFNDDADAARIIISDGSHTAQKRVGPIDDGAWHHYVATFDGTNLNLYIDHIVQGSAATFGYTISYAGTNECQIGGMNYGDIYIGSLDEIAVYNRAMTGAGVDSLWNSGNGITYPFTP